MQVDIQTEGFTLTDDLRSHIHRRLGFALSDHRMEIRRIQVVLSHGENPHGEARKCCRIGVTLSRQPDVVVEDTETDIHAAIDRAADRTGRTLRCRLVMSEATWPDYRKPD